MHAERPFDPNVEWSTTASKFDLQLDKALTRKAKKPKSIRESQVEDDHRDAVAADGGISFKFVSPARRSVPDRLDLRPVPPEHRDLVARYVRFTECKRPGEKPTPSQLREHERIRALGFVVDVVDQRTPKKKDLFK